MGTGTEVAIPQHHPGQGRSRRNCTGDYSQSNNNAQRPRKSDLAFAYNAIGIPAAAGALYAAFGVLLSPIIGALAMSLSSVAVIADAPRLRRLNL